MYKAEVITELSELPSLRSEWNRLWETGEARTPYQSWEWNYSWAKSLGKRASLFVVTLRELDGQLACIAPFQADRICGIYRRVTFNSQNASIYPDFIIKAGVEESVLNFLAGFLLNDAAADVIDLIVAEPSPTLRYLNSAIEIVGWRKNSSVDYTKRLLVDMGESYVDYLGTLSSKMRQEIRAEARKLEKQHKVAFYATDTDSDLESSMQILFQLNALKWVGDPEKKHPERRECYRALQRLGGARIFTLTCDDTPVGALSALLTDDTIFAEIAGFDFSIGKFDLGKIFYHYLFLWAQENGFRRIDFSSGEEPYKFRYNPQILGKWNFVAYSSTVPFLLTKLNFRLSRAAKQFRSGLINNRIYRSSGIHSLYIKIRNRVTDSTN